MTTTLTGLSNIVNITFDDTSPQFILNGTSWNIAAASDASNYFDQTFRFCSKKGDSFSFQFSGSAIWLFGGRRAKFGAYTVQLDDQPKTSFPAATGADQFQSVLFKQTNLDLTKDHTLVVTNDGNNADAFLLDFDYAIVQTQVGNSNAKMSFNKIEDTSTSITYSGNWIASNQFAEYSQKTNHLSRTTGDFAEYTFVGESIAVYGGVNADHGFYSVSLDGVVQPTFFGEYDRLVGQVVIFQASSLTSGVNHTVRLTNGVLAKNSTATAPNFDIDFILVNRSVSSTTSSSSSTLASSTSVPSTANQDPSATDITSTVALPSASNSQGSGETLTLPGETSSKAAPGVIAGAVVGSLGGLSLIVALVVLFLWKKKKLGRGGGEPEFESTNYVKRSPGGAPNILPTSPPVTHLYQHQGFSGNTLGPQSSQTPLTAQNLSQMDPRSMITPFPPWPTAPSVAPSDSTFFAGANTSPPSMLGSRYPTASNRISTAYSGPGMLQQRLRSDEEASLFRDSELDGASSSGRSSARRMPPLPPYAPSTSDLPVPTDQKPGLYRPLMVQNQRASNPLSLPASSPAEPMPPWTPPNRI